LRPCFIAASAGLLLLLRWAWALALSAVFLLAVYNLWIFASLHQGAALVQGLLNLVFFLYLVRPEVREDDKIRLHFRQEPIARDEEFQLIPRVLVCDLPERHARDSQRLARIFRVAKPGSCLLRELFRGHLNP
jgi:hypothetical protein